MILTALNNLYDMLSADDDFDIVPNGFSVAAVSHVITLDSEGNLVSINAVKLTGKGKIPHVRVPYQPGRGNGVHPYLLCDNVKNVLGFKAEVKDDKLSVLKVTYYEEHAAEFRRKNIEFLKNINIPAADAVIAFLNSWHPKDMMNNEIVKDKAIELTNGSEIAFTIMGTDEYLQNNPTVVDAVSKEAETATDDAIIGQCLVTGDVAPIARLHPKIKLPGSLVPPTLVSFNKECFESYGHTQGYNAPISVKAAFKYGAALNYLLLSLNNKINVGDTAVVFWADSENHKSTEELLRNSLDMLHTKYDDGTSKTIFKALKAASQGLPVDNFDVDYNSNIYMLTMSPNSSRIAIKNWQVNKTKDVFSHIAEHYNDLKIVGLDNERLLSPRTILLHLAPIKKDKYILPGQMELLISSIVSGKEYPHNFFVKAIQNCQKQGDNGGITSVRAAIIKAYLVRHKRLQNIKNTEEMITMALDRTNFNTAYLLGRIFRIMENAQYSALPYVNTTIKDKYLSAASKMPNRTMQILMTGYNQHIKKISSTKRGVAINIDKELSELLNHIDTIPNRLSMEEQGKFILGYYHQRYDDIEKANKRKEKGKSELQSTETEDEDTISNKVA